MNLLAKKLIYVKKKCLRFDIILKLKTIHGRTYRNKTKKPCLRQLPI